MGLYVKCWRPLVRLAAIRWSLPALLVRSSAGRCSAGPPKLVRQPAGPPVRWSAGPRVRPSPPVRWSAGPLVRWSAGSPVRRSLVRWSAGPPVRWSAGPPVRRSAGSPVRGSAGPLVRWSLVRRFAGPLVRWSAGPPVRWSAGPLFGLDGKGIVSACFTNICIFGSPKICRKYAFSLGKMLIFCIFSAYWPPQENAYYLDTCFLHIYAFFVQKISENMHFP